ncbi:MAG: YCF48-related protein, partial [Caldilineales bacterium]|nr:YCF48-related protein [Caldilineales bacterium]
AWAVGQDGTVLFSNDGGVSWQARGALTTTLYGVHFLDGQRGWVVGAGGFVARSTDGGLTWSAQTSGVTTALRRVRFFADGQYGLIVGDAGTLLTTTNGGATWTIRAGIVAASIHLRDIHIEGNEAWIVGDSDTLRYSNDRGVTWSARTVATGNHLYAVAFAPGQNQVGWVAGREGSIARTTNGGASWTNVTTVDGDSRTGRDLFALAAASTTRAWAGGSVLAVNDGNWDNGQVKRYQSWFIWRTTNGTAWSHVMGGHLPRFLAIVAPDDRTAYAVGDHVQALKTTDGGQTWRELYRQMRSDPATPPTADNIGSFLLGIDCASADDCHAVGRWALVLHTTDGGQTWRREYTPGYGGYLYDVQRPSPTRGLVVGTWRYFHTTNGGNNWVEAANNGGNTPGIDLEMISETTGAMSILKPFLKYTTDGGVNWANKSLPAAYGSWFFEAAEAIDTNNDGRLDRVWLAGCARAPGTWVHETPCQSAAVLRSSDGGNTWADTVFDPSFSKVLALQMADANTGWVAGENGALAVTTDGGATWTRIPVPADKHLHDVAVAHPGLVYVAGEENVILRYLAGSSRSLAAAPQQNIAFDGELNDWTMAGAAVVDAANADTVSDPPPTATDLSATVRARWWEDRLFFAIEVTDDQVTGDDRVEIALDGLNDDLGGGSDDRHFVFYHDGRLNTGSVPVTAVVRPVAGGYRLEIGIPAAALGGNFAAGRTLGLQIGLFDDGGGEQSRLLWAGTSMTAQPERFGTLTLQPFGGDTATLMAVPVGAMTMDGSLAEWSNEHILNLTAATADTQQGAAVTEADLSAEVRARWWPNYVFVGIRVRDDNVRPG